MIFINLKSNVRSTGERANFLFKNLADIKNETDVPIILVPHNLDIRKAKELWKGEIWTQNAEYNGGTGRNPVEMLNEWGGITGTFLNHSEHKYEGYHLLAKVVNQCNEYGLKSLVFAESVVEIEKILAPKVMPTYIAYEPSELVGSNDSSVAKSKPKSISEAVKMLKKSEIPLIVGAGIKDLDDVRKSVELGAVGIAVSSAVIHAEDVKAKVLELAKGFK